MKPGDLVKTGAGRVSLHRDMFWWWKPSHSGNPVVTVMEADAVGLVLGIVGDAREGHRHEEWCMILYGLTFGWRETRFFEVLS